MALILYFACAALLFSGCGFLFVMVRLSALARRQSAALEGVRS